MLSDANQVKSLFLAARLLSPDARSAFLDQACGVESSLRRSVESLLAAPEGIVSLAEPGDPGVTVDSHPQAPAPPEKNPLPTETAGTRIGPYKLLQQIGEGGMGVVWMAEQQEPVRRMVAVKVIKAGMDSAQVVARFEAERQALALMDHPNIAKVLDAGATDSGRPFFVMELIKGLPITRSSATSVALADTRAAGMLFVGVCHAVQHAHQKGVIHRDLKPSNVMVALYDGQPVPRIIDFGVAKSIGQALTQRTMFTAFKAIVGTLE